MSLGESSTALGKVRGLGSAREGGEQERRSSPVSRSVGQQHPSPPLEPPECSRAKPIFAATLRRAAS